MKENTQQRKRNSLLRSYPMVFIVLFFAFSFILIRGGVEVYAKQRNLAINFDERSKELSELTSYYENLNARVGQIDSEYGLEKYIRETYGLVKPGEEVLYVVPQKVDEVVFDKEQDEGFLKKLFK